MTSLLLLLIALLLLAAFSVYRLSGFLLRRFFALPQPAQPVLCFGLTAVVCAALCVLGLFSLQGLRSAEYEKGFLAAQSSAYQDETETTVSLEEFQKAYVNGYADGYNDGYESGSFRRENATGNSGDDSLAAGDSAGSEPQDWEPGDSEEDTMPAEPGDTAEKDSNTSNELNDHDHGDSGAEEEDTSAGTEDEKAPASGVTVYYTATGSVLHKDRNCSYLKRANAILESDATDSPDLPPCSRCG